MPGARTRGRPPCSAAQGPPHQCGPEWPRALAWMRQTPDGGTTGMVTVLIAIAWLVGVACAAWSAPGGVIAPLVAPAAIALTVRRNRPLEGVALAVLCAGVAVLAVARWQAATAPPPAGSIAYLASGGRMRLHGVLRGDPQIGARSQRMRVDVHEADTGSGWRPVSGSVLVRVALGRQYRDGDAVLIDGRLSLPPELDHFDYRAYLARQGIRAQLDYPRVLITGHERRWLPARLITRLRRASSAALDRVLPQPEAALARGIVVGDRSAIPDAVVDDFNRTGTSHLIAISGFNITLVAGMVAAALAWIIGRRWAAATALAAITAYALFVGLSPSVARALVMGALVILARLAGRPGAPLLALMLAAVAMTVQDPRVLDDAGFQLSFGATAGIMLLTPSLSAFMARLADRIGAPAPIPSVLLSVMETASVTLAATIATLPVMLHAFGTLSLAALPVNLVLVPLFPLVMLTSIMAAVLGALPLPLAPAAGALAWPPLAFTIAVAHHSARLPGASASVGPVGGPLTLALYAVIGALAALLNRGGASPAAADLVSGSPLRLHGPAAFAVPAACLALLAAGATVVGLRGRAPDGRLAVAFIDVGGAPAALVAGPGGERVLVDTGPDGTALMRALDPLLPHGHAVNLVVISRLSPAATGGLATAAGRYGASLVVGPAGDGAPLTVGNARYIALEPGSSARLSGGARLEFEAAPGERGRIAVTAVMGARRIAITAGAEGDAGTERDGAGSAAITVDIGGMPLLTYDVRRQGPVLLSTDGRDLRVRPARGPALTPSLDARIAGAHACTHAAGPGALC